MSAIRDAAHDRLKEEAQSESTELKDALLEPANVDAVLLRVVFLRAFNSPASTPSTSVDASFIIRLTQLSIAELSADTDIVVMEYKMKKKLSNVIT
jgi:hypothetical protein